MKKNNKTKIEFGDFQTPKSLADEICQYLNKIGINPEIIIEPTCGLGVFLRSGAENFHDLKKIFGFDINESYIAPLALELKKYSDLPNAHIECIDFFRKDWNSFISSLNGRLLIVGNLPWVTNSGLGKISGENSPEKSNFLKMKGFDAISGKSNFDISEWMIIEILHWLSHRGGDIALLVKTSVARKILAHTERENTPVTKFQLVKIDAKKHFSAAVDACLMVIQIEPSAVSFHDCTVFSGFDDVDGQKLGRRSGLSINDTNAYAEYGFLLGQSPRKWRSGIKHDASKIMEFTKSGELLENGLGEQVDLEPDFLFPLMKGSDIGSNKPWRNKFILITQRKIGEKTDLLKIAAPKTWQYLEKHADRLDARASSIYKKNPKFSIFGVGDYAFKPWRIAICSLYKHLGFRLIEPIGDHPVMFDDTVYYISFESKHDACEVLEKLRSKQITKLLSSLIFWDDKRPIKTSILNLIDWSKIDTAPTIDQLEFAI